MRDHTPANTQNDKLNDQVADTDGEKGIFERIIFTIEVDARSAFMSILSNCLAHGRGCGDVQISPAKQGRALAQ